MKSLDTFIEFANANAQNDSNSLINTGDLINLVFFILLGILLVGVFLSAFYLRKKKNKIPFLSASLCSILFVSLAWGICSGLPKANADKILQVSVPDIVRAEVGDNISITEGYIENTGQEAVSFSQIAVNNIEDNDYSWTVKTQDQLLYDGKSGNVQKFFPCLKIDAGQKIPIYFSTNASIDSVLNFIGKQIVKVTFTVAETDVNCSANDLKVDDKISPIDVVSKNPTFSWKFNSNLTGQKQTAYQLKVKDKNSCIWDSGKVESSDTKIVLNSPVLQELSNYTWDLTLYDKFGWQLPAASSSFSTAYFDNAMPDSSYISYQNPKCLPGGERYISNYSIDFDFIPEKNGGNPLASANICFNLINSQNFLRWNYFETDGKIDLIKQQRSNGDMHDLNRVKAVMSLDDFVDKAHHTQILVDGTKIITYLDGKVIDEDTSTFKNPVYLYKIGFYTKEAMPPEIHEISSVTNIVVKDLSSNPVKVVYENKFDKGIIGFHHDFSAKIEKHDDDTYWLKLGIVDSFSRPEPLVEWDNETGNLPAFRKEFDCSKQIENAKLYTSGLGSYEAYINGERVGKYQLQNNFVENKYKQFYLVNDVTSLIKNQNTLSAVVGDCWWADTCAAYSGADDAFRAELVINYTDGSSSKICTDTSWKAAPANPITKADIFGGESYDARTDTSWKYNGYNEAGWNQVKINHEFNGGTLVSWIGNKIIEREDLLLEPVESYVYKGTKDVSDSQYGNVIKVNSSHKNVVEIQPGQTLVVDFGQNAAGWEGFDISGPRNTNLTIKHAEVLNEQNGVKSRGNDGPGGSGYYANLRGAKATTHYILNGLNESYHPSMTFYGYRYIEITADDIVTISNIKSHVITSVEQDNGNFSTNNDLLNKLVKNAKWGMYSNYLGVPTDCPQRDERQGWTADTQVFSEAGIYLSNAKTFLEKFCNDMKDNQITHRPDGAYPGMCPSGGFFFDRDCGAFGWADAGIILPYTLYTMYGDKTVIENNWNSMEHYVKDYIPTQCSDKHHGPIRGWGDHLAPRPEDNDDLVRDILACEFYCYDLKLMGQMADLLGKDSTYYKNKLKEENDWFLAHYFVNEELTKNTTQTVCLYALYLDLIPEANRNKIKDCLIDDIKTQGNNLGTGFLGTKILLDVLTRYGESDLAYQLLLNTKCPSWLYPVTKGATTFWERWNSYTDEEGYGGLAGMNSFNHYAYGAVVAWMYKYMAGIQASFEAPGFKDIIMNPIPTDLIKDVNADFESDYGKISAHSEKTSSTWKYDFTIPTGSTAHLQLPSLNYSDIKINGKQLNELSLEIDGIELDGEKALKVNPGSFSLNAELN